MAKTQIRTSNSSPEILSVRQRLTHTPEHDETAICFASSSTCFLIKFPTWTARALPYWNEALGKEVGWSTEDQIHPPENSYSPNYKQAAPMIPATCLAGLEESHRDRRRVHFEEPCMLWEYQRITKLETTPLPILFNLSITCFCHCWGHGVLHLPSTAEILEYGVLQKVLHRGRLTWKMMMKTDLCQ